MGNWKTIADVMETKSAKAVEEHYWELFMGTHGYCLPAQCLVQNELRETASLFPNAPADLPPCSEEDLSNANVVRAVDQAAAYYERTLKDDLYRIGVNLTHSRGEVVRREVGKEGGGKKKDEARERLATLPGADLPGFMPLREDFEVEYENDAEQVLANMDFNPDDHPSEIALKLQVINIYNRKLAERNERKRFVIDRGLIDFKAQQTKERKLSKDERDLAARFRVFARFLSAADYDALVEGVIKARRLQAQIDLYKYYKALGIRTLDEAKDYEQQKKTNAMSARMQRQSAPHLLPGDKRSEDGLGIVKKKRGRPPKNPPSTDPATGAASLTVNGSGNGSSNSLADGSVEKRSRRDSPAQLTPAVLASTKDVLRRAPCADKLVDLELELCAKVPLLPTHYLAIKEAIVREAFKTGALTKEGLEHTVKVRCPVSKTNTCADEVMQLNEPQRELIYDFFVKEVLVNQPPNRTPS